MTGAFCERCGSALTQADAFCQQCGAQVPVAAPRTRPEPTTVASGTRAKPTAGVAAASHSRMNAVKQAPPAKAAALRGVLTPGHARRARSTAWIYYAILALLSVIAAVAGKPIGLLGAVVCAAYSYYLYQGGRIVIWFW